MMYPTGRVRAHAFDRRRDCAIGVLLHRRPKGAMALPTTRGGAGTASTGRQDSVVHVRADSDSYLEALFNHLVDPAKAPNLRQRNLPPLRQRNLPESFFSQAPGSGAGAVVNNHHSRDNSADSGYTTTTANGTQALRGKATKIYTEETPVSGGHLFFS